MFCSVADRRAAVPVLGSWAARPKILAMNSRVRRGSGKPKRLACRPCSFLTATINKVVNPHCMRSGRPKRLAQGSNGQLFRVCRSSGAGRGLLNACRNPGPTRYRDTSWWALGAVGLPASASDCLGCSSGGRLDCPDLRKGHRTETVQAVKETIRRPLKVKLC